MNSRLRIMVAPAYLFASLVIGGSAQGVWFNMLLQLAGLAIIAWAALDTDDAPLAPAARQLLLLALAGVALVVFQLVPLPAELWAKAGGRTAIAQGFEVLGMPVPWAPLSLTPASSLSSLLGIIPPLAIFCAMTRLKAYRPQGLAVALVAATLAGIALGALQVASSGGEQATGYLYRNTNPGSAVGFFANLNHMGTLLVVTIPFLAALVAAAKSGKVQRYSAVIAICAGLALLVMVGIALNGSIAAYGLAIPAAAASLLILLPPASRLRAWVLGIAALLVVGSVAALQTSSIGATAIGEHASTSVQSRAEILSTTMKAVGDFMPFGSGLGSFASVYQLNELPTKVSGTFVVHAHNDYAQLLLELGLAGAVLILLFLAWWAVAVWRVWATTEPKPFPRAAAIASAAILVHSLVDFPLRTAAIAVLFGMCLGLLADGRAAPPKEKSTLRRKRHVEFR